MSLFYQHEATGRPALALRLGRELCQIERRQGLAGGQPVKAPAEVAFFLGGETLSVGGVLCGEAGGDQNRFSGIQAAPVDLWRKARTVDCEMAHGATHCAGRGQACRRQTGRFSAIPRSVTVSIGCRGYCAPPWSCSAVSRAPPWECTPQARTVLRD